MLEMPLHDLTCRAHDQASVFVELGVTVDLIVPQSICSPQPSVLLTCTCIFVCAQIHGNNMLCNHKAAEFHKVQFNLLAKG